MAQNDIYVIERSDDGAETRPKAKDGCPKLCKVSSCGLSPVICDLHGLSWAGSVHCMQHFVADVWLSSHLCLGISVFPASPSQVRSVPSESFLRALPALAQMCAAFSGLHLKPGSEASASPKV